MWSVGTERAEPSAAATASADRPRSEGFRPHWRIAVIKLRVFTPQCEATFFSQRLWMLALQTSHCRPCRIRPKRREPQCSQKVGSMYVWMRNLWGTLMLNRFYKATTPSQHDSWKGGKRKRDFSTG